MTPPRHYLRPNVALEPLFAGWYAWPHLISPATAAMNVLGRHLKIMDSYIQAPHIHAAAMQNPKMRGGPFMDYPRDRSAEVAELREWTLQNQSHLIDLANAIKELHHMLEQEAKGFGMDALYAKVPESLRGYVELFYDLDDQPSFRFFESLLYRSRYYERRFQSISLFLVDRDERPFLLSTPKLEEEGVVRLSIPFDDPRIDELFAMRRHGGDVEAMLRRFEIPEQQADLFRSFFTEEAPEFHRKYQGKGARARYFGHACVLVESEDVAILTDPVVSYAYEDSLSRLTYRDLPDTIDYVVITHNHQDHVLLETLLQLRHRIDEIIIPRGGRETLQDPSLKQALHAIGFSKVTELGELEEIRRSGCTITGVPFLGEHCDLDIRTKVCYHVRLTELSILFAADSCNIEPRLYQHIHDEIGDVDVLFLGMECDGAPLSWLYGPLLARALSRSKDQSRRLSGSDFERGLDLVERFNPRDVYVYAMGQEPWLGYVMSLEYAETSNPIVASNKLVEACRDRGIVAERLFGQKEIVYA